MRRRRLRRPPEGRAAGRLTDRLDKAGHVFGGGSDLVHRFPDMPTRTISFRQPLAKVARQFMPIGRQQGEKADVLARFLEFSVVARPMLASDGTTMS